MDQKLQAHKLRRALHYAQTIANYRAPMKPLLATRQRQKQACRTLANQLGLTLVEIITTLVIIAISAFFAAPEILNWRANMRASSAARDLYSVLNAARVSAVDKNSNIIVTVNTTPTNTVTITVDDGAGGGTASDNIYQVGETLLNTLTFNTNVSGRDYRGAHIHAVTITAPRGFTPRGLPIGGNTGEIRIRNAGSDRWYKITVSGSGSLALLQSNDSTDGANGTWN